MEIVSCIITCIFGISAIGLLVYLAKYWIDNRFSDTLKEVKDETHSELELLQKRVKIQDEFIKNYQLLLESKEEELVNLSSEKDKNIVKNKDLEEFFKAEEVCDLLNDILKYIQENEDSQLVEYPEVVKYIESLKKIYGLKEKDHE